MRTTHTERKNHFLQHMMQARETRQQMFFWMQQTGITESAQGISAERDALEQRLTTHHTNFNTNPRQVSLLELQNLYQEFRHNYTQAAALLDVTDSYEQMMGALPTPVVTIPHTLFYVSLRLNKNTHQSPSCSRMSQRPQNP